MPNVLWFRRDLRVGDNPALSAAAAGSQSGVVPLFVLDEALWKPAGSRRRSYLAASLRALDADLGGKLVVRHGDPAVEVVELARQVGAEQVHIAADFGPYGRRRDDRVARACADAGVELVRTGSPYAIAPGRVTKGDGSAYAVFTPFYRAWLAHGWRAPAQTPDGPQWLAVDRSPLDEVVPAEPALDVANLPGIGEQAALALWADWRDTHLGDYDSERDRPDFATTSRLSVPLKYGEIHPRTILADLSARRGKAVDAFRRQVAWREFYADVLWHHPESAREYLRADVATMPYDSGPSAEQRFEAWAAGRTGFPYIDAGMRQLAAEGYLHNRVRLAVASFLTKDLHLDWRRGARHFMTVLVDGDLASNNHNWQWVAGSGTDPAPYYRIFNPITQGEKFDPEGEYVRRWVPELRELAGKAVHTPWDAPGGIPAGYPERIVDHATERAEALRRYADR